MSSPAQQHRVTPLLASTALELSAITEADAGVIGDESHRLETYQDFVEHGTAVEGGSATNRIWSDKSYIPLTIATQCIDCLHCVVACPHQAIDYEIRAYNVSPLIRAGKALASRLPGIELDPATNREIVTKGATDYSHCKGCFVCGTACPTGAIHFVPVNNVDTAAFDGAKLEPEQVASVLVTPDEQDVDFVRQVLDRVTAEQAGWGPGEKRDGSIYNGSELLSRFVFQAGFDGASLYPITPNTVFQQYLEAGVNARAGGNLQLRSCLSEESGYAWLTGLAVQGKRTLMAQGSQSLAQLYEHMNINPGLHLPVFMFEMTRALAPGTSIKPDHTTTLRTADTGEIILFGRSLQDNYDRSLLLLKLMESEGVWVPGRLVIKGFVETHAVSSERQAAVTLLASEQVEEFLGREKNPFVFQPDKDISVGILDFDARYAEQRQAIDSVLDRAGENFAACARQLAAFTGRPEIPEVSRFPATGEFDFALISLDDPDMNTAEYVCESLRRQGVKAGVVSISLYRPFPAAKLRTAVEGCKAVAILEYSNRSGRAGGAQFADEVRAALYSLATPPLSFAVQAGLGGRVVSVSYLMLLNRMMADLAGGNDSATARWLKDHSVDGAFGLGIRGNPLPQTDARFDLPLKQPGIHETVIVGKGGQGVLLLNAVLTGMATLCGEYAMSMVGYGALQRGGGINLSFRHGKEKIRDYSDIVMPDTLVSFEFDIHLQAMLPQLAPGGTLILDGDQDQRSHYEAHLPEAAQLVIIPARSIAREIYGNANQTNAVLLGALLAHLGIEREQTLQYLLDNVVNIPEMAKEAALVNREPNRRACLAGFLAYSMQASRDSEPSPATGQAADLRGLVLPPAILRVVDRPAALARLKRRYALRKALYRGLFQFHPMVNQLQTMYLRLRGHQPVSGGDMACGGCGQINIFRTVFNFLESLQPDTGRIFVSEQDGCGTVFSGLNRTSIWNMPYVRIAYETAHGVAAGLASGVGDTDLVVSISGDGGMMQGARSVEDVLHQRDPVLHIVVVNQVLGNTGGQATIATTVGARTREGHQSTHQPLDFLRVAEKYSVQGAVASTVHLGDLYKKLRRAHRVVSQHRQPFLLVMHFSCLEQGVNLAESLILQKKALDAHYFNLYSLHYKMVCNADGQALYRKKRVVIDWYPWTFGKRAWKDQLLRYASSQGMMRHFARDDTALEQAYGQVRGQWQALKQEAGPLRYYLGFLRNLFSLDRITMARLIRKQAPEQASSGATG